MYSHKIPWLSTGDYILNNTFFFFLRAKQMKCTNKKHTRIAFLKTHKTGGSTFTSILNRFVDNNFLDIAIPVNDVRFNWPAPFSHQYVQLSRLKDKHADVLNNHCVLNRRELSKVMKPGYRLVTILRDPVRQFYSMFHYLNLPKHYNLRNESDPVSVFIKNPQKYHHYKPYLKVGREKYFEENLIHNGNLYDLNFMRFRESGDTERGLKDFITYMEKAFHLVMITEKYDESLILLKNLMCWEFMDIVYEKRLVNPDLKNISQNITDEVKRDIQDWNYQDKVLYDHFSQRLDKIIALQDQKKFRDDVTNFRKLNNAVLNFCANATGNGDYSIDKFNNIVEILKTLGEDLQKGFMEKPECFCKKLKRRERDYLTFFAKRFPPFYFVKTFARPQSKNDC